MVLDQVVNETAHKTLGLRAVKTASFQPAAVSDDGRKASHLVSPGDAHIFVGIDFRQHELALVLLGKSFQHRSHHPTRAAPLGANVEQNRHRLRPSQHALVKIRFHCVIGEFEHVNTSLRGPCVCAVWPYHRQSSDEKANVGLASKLHEGGGPTVFNAVNELAVLKIEQIDRHLAGDKLDV